MKALKRFIAIFMCVVLTLTAAPLQGFVGLDLLSLFDFKAEAATYSGTCGDNLTWSLDTISGVLTISGEGDMYNYTYGSSAPWHSYRSYIETVNIAAGVRTIGDSAFNNCENLTSITIPDSVTSIGKYVFRYCYNLTSVTIPDSVITIGEHTFYDCDSLESITIPDSVTTVGESVFYYCDNLTSVIIGNSVTTIGRSAFYWCESLTSVTIGNSVTSIGYQAFYYCDSLTSITIPDSVTTIDDYAFYSCDNLTGITIPDSIISIGDDAFGDCDSLTSITVDENNSYYSSDEYGVLFNKDKTELVQYPIGNTRTSYTIPDSVTVIGDDAFEACHNLTSVTIPDGVTTIGNSAFRTCYYLKSITIPDSVTAIGDSAFGYCFLRSITVDETNKYYSNDEYGVLFNKDKTELIQYPISNARTSYTIPDSVTSIGNHAFQYCSTLTSITISDGVTSIGEYAFYDCGNLTSITIPDGVTSIGMYAFSYTGIEDNSDNWINGVFYIGNHLIEAESTLYGSYTIKDATLTIADNAFDSCKSLKKITIPDSVTVIGKDAFSFCDSLTSVTLPVNLTIIGERVFYSCESLTNITIPNSVTIIGDSAFENCDSLTNVYYNGTQSQWAEISIDTGNDPLTSATVHFLNDEESTTEEYTTEEWTTEEDVTQEYIDEESTYIIDETTTVPVTEQPSIEDESDLDHTTTTRAPETTTREPETTEVAPADPDGFITMSVGETKTVSVTGGSLTYIRFVPNETAIYTFCSSGDSDTYGYLYNSDMEQLVYDDDSGSGNNFRIIHGLNAGETYYIGVRFYNSSASGSITVNLTETNGCGNNLTWSFNESTGVLKISGTGEMYDYLSWNSSSDSYDFTPRPWDEYIASITSVEVCSGITYIGSGAFTDLYNIKTVSLPETVGEIGKWAFAACISLTGFTVDEDNPIFMADEDGVLYGREDMNALPEEYRNEEYEYALVLFNYPIGNGVREYTVAENVYAVGDYAFAFCPTLEKITFPQTYLSLGEAVLSNCPALRTVTLNPLKLIDIDDNNYDWLEQCPELIYSIEADCGENVKSSLIINAKEESVCGTLTISGTGAMYNYESYSDQPWRVISDFITEVLIEDGVTTIGDNAFKYCSSINSVTIPESVTNIGYCAFGYCDNLFDVYYGSSMEDWEKIAIDERNESLLSAIIHTYECEHIVDQFSWETVKEPTCTPGLEIATCSVCGIRGGEKTVVCDSSTYPESAHNYDNNADQIWDFSYTGAKKLILKFSASTVTENGYDYIYIYDGNGSQIGKYCGTQLSGRKIIIEGSSFGIRLTSDGSVTQYGFSFDSVSARVDNELNKVIPAVAEHDWSGKDGVCANGCGTECVHATNAQGVCEVCGRSCAELGHVFKFGKCSVCGKTGGTCGENLTWVIDKNTGTLTISGTGEMYDYTDSGAPWIMLWKSITDVIVEDGVTAIGDYAFRNCSNIENAAISASVITIGERAFGNEFSKLKSVTFGENSKLTTIGDEAFSYCESLEGITIPASVTEIGERAFIGCQSINVDEANEEYCSVEGVLYSKDKTVLIQYPAGKADTEFTIPDTVKKIGAYAFAYCYNLETLIIPDSVTTIEEYAFYFSEFEIVSSFGSLTEIGDYAFAYCDFTTFDIPEGVETIGNYAFYDCYNLRSVTIPDSVTVIGSYAFAWCQNLQSVTIPDSVVAVGKGAFNRCYGLTSAEIGSGLKRIPQNMFESCYNLTDIEISEGVTDIGDFAFYGCEALKTVKIPASVSTIGTEAFDSCGSLEGFDVSEDNGSFYSENGVLFNKDKTVLICYPAGKTARSYTVPSTVTEILPYAFSGAANLRQITIPATVTTIGEYAFSYSGLMSVELENGITVIGEYAFANCIKLESVSIPATVTSIEAYAFYRCSNLTDVYYYSTSENWNKIEIDSNNYHLDYPTIHYVNIQAEDYEFINGELIVTGGSTVATRFSNLDFAQDITKITVKGEVEQILEFVFADLSNVTEVNIAKTVSSIGNFAFENCPKLKTVNLDVEFEEESVEEETTEEPVCEISEENSDWDIAYNGEIVPNAEAEDNVTTTTRAYTTTTKPPTTTTVPTTTVAPTTTTQEDTQEYTTIIRDERPTTTRPYEEPEEDEYPSYRTIGIMAFAGCESLENIVIPETFKTIGNYAFADCTKLNSVTLNDGLKNIGSAAFNNCTSLSEITIPVSTKEMGYDAFYGCSSLETVHFNAVNCDITSASDDEKLIFGERDSLKNFYFGDKVHTIPYEILRGNSSITEIVIPDNVKYISSYAFMDCSALTRAVIGSGVADMGHSVFKYCDALTDVIILEGVKVIGDIAFSDCDSLKSVTIPDSVTELGIQAFSCCDSLQNVMIGKGLTYLHDYGGDWYSGHAFLGCSNLVNITVDEDNECFVISDDGVLFSKDGAKLVCYPIGKPNTTYTIPEGVKEVGMGSFYNCCNLVSIGIPTSVEVIDSFALLMGDNLTDAYYAGNEEQWYEIWGCYGALPDGTTLHFNSTVPDAAVASGTCGENLTWTLDANGKLTISGTGEMDNFEDGTEPWYRFKSSILQVVVEEGVTTIGDGAFFDCVNLKGVELGTDVKNIGWSAFSYCKGLEIVTLPDSVTTVGRWAFSNCSSLTDVYYGGTQGQWNIISFDAYNEPLTSATIHFSGENSGTVVDRGTCGDNLTWVIYDDGELVINGTGDMYNYTYLGQTPWAEYNDRIVEITVGEGVTSVGIGAFYGCSAVKSIILPSTVYNIRLFAFGACTALEAINVSTDNALFCSVDGVVYSKDKSTLVRYPAGKTATGFNIPDSVEVIGNEAFSESVSLESVIIPESVKKIDYHAFYSSQALKTVEIPASVEIIGNNVFDACYSLDAINVSADNAIYSSADGVLFNKTRTELIYYPAAKGTTYTIPDGVKTIKENAFLFSNVNTFVIPTSVTVIEAAQCKYGSANKTVHYAGTKAEWNKISIDSSEGLNDALINANVHFDGEKIEYETSNCKISIKRPKVNEVNYGDVLIFEAVTNDLPEGAKVVWSVSGDISSKPIISNDGMNCEVYAKGKGEIKVTATVVNAEGVPYQNVNGNIIKAQKSFTVKAGFREIFIWILKSLFGLTTVYTPETFL